MVDKYYKSLGNKVASGDLVDLKKLLENNPEDLTKKKAIYLIICCCTTCNAYLNTPSKLNEQDIISCIQSLAKRIVDVTSDEFDKYLQSIYHICKFLLKKDFRLVLRLEHEILPPFIPITLTETQIATYKSICQLLKLETINTNQTKEPIDKDSINQMGYFMSKILKTTMNHVIFSEIIFDFGTRITNLNIDLNDQYKYFLHNLDIMKSFNNTDRSHGIMHFIKCGMFIFIQQIKDGAFIEAKLCLSKLMEAIPKLPECLVLKEILKICEFMQDLNCNIHELSEYKDNFLNSMKQHGNDDSIRSICKAIAQAVYWYSCHYKNTNNIIFENLELHMSFYETLQKIMAFLTYYMKACTVKCECSTFKGVPEGVYLVAAIMNFFSAFIIKHEVSRESIKKVVSHLEKFSKFLVTLKKNNCDKWFSYWSELLRYIYNLAIIIYKKDKYEEALSICHVILKYHSLLGDLNEEVLLHTMSLMNVAYLKLNKYSESLLWTSVEILNTNKLSRGKLFANIIKIKVAARDTTCNIQELNVCTILDKIPKEYECYLKDITTNKELQTELLISELEIYDKKWKSKIPMLSAFKQLTKIAANNVLMKVFVDIFSCWELNVHEDMEQLLENVFEHYKQSNNNKYNVYVNYFRYKIQTQKIITTNTETMNKTVKAREAETHTENIIGSDALDKCDVVSVYEGLRIDSEKIELLKKCLNNLEQLVESCTPDVDLQKLYTISNNVAFEFSVHSDVYNFLKALNLGLKIAKCLKNNEYVLECSGFILKHIRSAEFEREMKKIAKKIGNKSLYLIQFYVNLSYGYLYYDLNVALKYLRAAVDCLKCCKEECGKKLWYVEATVELLTFELMQVNGGKEFSYRPLLRAYEIVVDKFNTEPEWKPKHFALFYKASGVLIKTYHELRMPREVRFYGKQTLHLAQQYSIPIESTKTLNYLAHADYRSGRWDDYRVKLDGIAQILLLDKALKDNQLKRDTSRQEKQVVPTINVITEGIRDVNLNNGDFNVKLSTSSPSFICESYQQPSFSYHENCECFQCTSPEYHELVLARSHLEALWYTHLKQVELADSFFKGTMNFSRVLSRKQLVTPNSLNALIKIPKQLQRNNNINKCYYNCSVDYVKFLYVCVTPEAAEEYNKNLLEQVRAEKTYHATVYAEILLQKLKFMYMLKRVRTELVPPQLPACKTPESRNPKIVKIATNSPKIKSFYAPKIIKFNLDEENKQTPGVKTPKTVNLPPSLRAAKTPLLKTPKEHRLPLVELADKAKDVKMKDNLLEVKTEKLGVKSKTRSGTRKKLDLNTARIEDDKSTSRRATRRNRT